MLPPLSQKYTEPGKGQGNLKKKVTNLSLKLKFPLDKIYNIDDTHRTYITKPYYYGIKTKNIVIFDNLLKKLKDEEVEAMVCQTVAYYFLGHIKYYIVFVITQFIILYYGFVIFVTSESLVFSFGYKEYSIFMGSSLFLVFYTNFSYFSNMANIKLSRHCELKADNFAVGKGFGENLISGVTKAEKDNVNNIDLDPIYQSFNIPYRSVDDLKKQQEQHLAKNIKKN
jgi:STE24 endopeptidase